MPRAQKAPKEAMPAPSATYQKVGLLPRVVMTSRIEASSAAGRGGSKAPRGGSFKDRLDELLGDGQTETGVTGRALHQRRAGLQQTLLLGPA